MANIEQLNAVIESTMLGTEDHGIFTCLLYLKHERGSQAFGGYALDAPPKERRAGFERIGTAFGLEFIARILRTLDVESWERLKGTRLRIRQEHGKIHAIGHFLEDRWFNPEQDLKAFCLGE